MNSRPHSPTPNPEAKRIVSARLPDGSLVELVHDLGADRTRIARWSSGKVEITDTIAVEGEQPLMPVSSRNNLIRHRVVLFPESAERYPSVGRLVADIESYIARYVDLSEEFLGVATAYVLLSWVHDAFNELPYLRFRGEWGSGKTRALLIIGSICYKPFFASGASTVSPIFHTLDAFGGTLVADETDFRFSDEKAELVKIFNNGNVRGFPVLRSSANAQGTFDPRAFSVFGPKIVAMRHSFDDQALESRFLTHEMGTRHLPRGIPINLPDLQRDEARALRNQLLWYRFTTLDRMAINADVYDTKLSARLNQIVAPLLSVAIDEKMRAAIRRAAGAIENRLRDNRSGTPEAHVLEAVLSLRSDAARDYITIGAITDVFIRKHGADYDRPLTPRYVGHLLRNRLRLFTYKRHGTFVLPLVQDDHLRLLAEQYGIGETETELP